MDTSAGRKRQKKREEKKSELGDTALVRVMNGSPLSKWRKNDWRVQKGMDPRKTQMADN